MDPDRRTVQPGDLRIEGEKFGGVVPPGTCTGEFLDARDTFLIPGLIDAHVHGWGNPSPRTHKGRDDDDEVDRAGVLARVLRAGVMATVDLAGSDERLALRDSLRASPDHAALFVASTFYAAPATETSATEAALRARVRTRVARRPDLIKIIAAGGPVAPIVDEAKRQGLATVVHIGEWQHARQAIAAGAAAITHFEDEATIPDDLAAAWAAAKVVSIPTMAVQCDVHTLVAQPALLDDPLLIAMTRPGLRAAYRDRSGWSDKARHWAQWQKAGCEPHDFPTLRRLHAAGEKVLAGSDPGNLGTFQGFSLHRELELMAKAGLPPWDVLRAATTEAAAFLRIPWGFQPGAPANFVLLRASPIPSLRNTRAIAQVIYRGRSLFPGAGTKGGKRSIAPMSGAEK
ncbi:MAG TPA: amidohydrolase family protein [Polyangia bacterium]